MTLDDLKKLATGSLLFSLDRIIAPRLINIFYLLGLATIVLWAISHFFATFAFGLGSGLWGILEITVFGLLGFVALRIGCEAAIVYFKANEHTADAVNQARPSANSLIDEVRDAIEELAEEDDDTPAIEAPVSSKTTPKAATKKAPASKAASKPRSASKNNTTTKS